MLYDPDVASQAHLLGLVPIASYISFCPQCLPSTHPYLQLHTLLMTVDCLHFEVNAHGADKGRGEGVVSIAEEEGGLTDAAVANDEQFEHVVKILVRGIFDSSFTISY